MEGGMVSNVVLILLIALIVLIALIIVNISMRLNRLQKKYEAFLKGRDGRTLERVITDRLADIEKINALSGKNSNSIAQLQYLFGTSLNKYGIVKYDAFDDVGGKMSFALALLDTEDSGFILNTVHSRDNCFIYLKEIVKGESYIMLSNEEIEALRKAAASRSEEIEATLELKRRRKRRSSRDPERVERKNKAEVEYVSDEEYFD